MQELVHSTDSAFLVRLTALQFIHAGTPLQSGEDSTGNAYSVDDAVRLLDLYSKAITEMTGKPFRT